MSKIGKMPIALASGITVTTQGSTVQVNGPKGNVSYALPEGITIAVEENKVQVKAKSIEDRELRALYGLTRANLANIIKGVDSGFEKRLEMVGVGYRAQMQGRTLVLSLGFSHPVNYIPEDGITIAVGENNTIIISGTDKGMVGQTAAKIRAIRPPEPYKGKGIKYKGERIRRKAGKAAKAAGK